MRASSKYLVAVALLAILAVVFGFAGMSAPISKLTIPQQESEEDTLTHFQNPPTYDSGWLDITDKTARYFNVTHNLNSTDVIVDLTGKITSTGEVHQKNHGGDGYVPREAGTCGGTHAYSVVQTTDGGYVLAGDVNFGTGAGNYDFYLVKMDWDGNFQWNQTYGGTENDYGRSVIQTTDGGYALAGYTYSFGAGSSDIWLVKTDSTGNVQWNQTYGGTDVDQAYSLIQTTDGGYALAGNTGPFAFAADFWLVKTNSTGNVQWNQTYGGTEHDYGRCVVQTVDGGYALAGYTKSFGAGGYDFWLVKTNSTGNREWNKSYGGTENDYGRSVIQTTDGGYALAGYTYSFGAGSSDIWLVKTDSVGTKVGSQTYGGTDYDLGYSLIQTTDGGYAIAGYTRSYSSAGNDNLWLIKTGSNGIAQWNRTYIGERVESIGHSAIQTSDEGYAIAGEVTMHMWRTSWLVITNTNGEWIYSDSFKYGLAWMDSTSDSIILYRGTDDPDWNFLRVRIWTIEEPTWQFGDINQDGVVDASDLFILSQNYGKTFSLLSLSGIAAVAGIHTYKKRKQPK